MKITSEHDAEALFWAARFKECLATAQSPILLGLASLQTDRPVDPYLTAVPREWMAYFLAASSIRRGEYKNVRLLDQTPIPEGNTYLNVMVPYYRAFADWKRGITSRDCLHEYAFDISSDFGRGMMLQMQAWHDEERGMFKQHCSGLLKAIGEMFKENNLPVYWIARTLSACLHSSTEIGERNVTERCEEIYNTLPWPPDLEHERFECLRAIARGQFLAGDIPTTIVTLRKAKDCEVSPSCHAAAFLHCATIAQYTGSLIWETDQIEHAASLFNKPNATRCQEYGSVALALALHYIPINSDLAETFMKQFYASSLSPNSSLAHDRRMAAQADVILGKIALRRGEHRHGYKTILKAYTTLMGYGFYFRAAQAAEEIALLERGQKNRTAWLEKAMAAAMIYGPLNPLLPHLKRLVGQENVHLSSRESEVMRGLLENLTNRQIAERLGITLHYAEKVVGRVFCKHRITGANKRAELIHKMLLK